MLKLLTPPETETSSAASEMQARGPPAAQSRLPGRPRLRRPAPSHYVPCNSLRRLLLSLRSFIHSPASGAESAVKSFLEGSASNRSRLAKGEGGRGGGGEETLVLKGAELLRWLAGVVAKRKAKARVAPSLPFGVHYPVFGS